MNYFFKWFDSDQNENNWFYEEYTQCLETV